MSRTPYKKSDLRFVQAETPLNAQRRALQNSCLVLFPTPEVRLFVTQVTEQFIKAFDSASKRLQYVNSINEFEDACKRRYQDLLALATSVQSALDDNLSLTVQRRRGDKITQYHYKYENKLQVVDEDDPDYVVYLNTRNPKCYTPLFRGMFTCIVDLREIEQWDPLYNEVKSAIVYFLSLGKMYENLRGNVDYINYCEEKSLQSMTTPAKQLDGRYNKIIDLLDEIRICVSGEIRTPKYLREFVNSLNAHPLAEYSDKDYHLSFRSTGVKIKGIKGTIPGLLAALVETDECYPQDSIIGYKSNYNKSALPQVTEKKDHTISIEQSKLKRRIIHQTSNGKQDRCSYFHNHMNSIIRSLRSDCTFNQSRGIDFIRQVTSENFREMYRNSVYCLDISDATGTVSQQYQKDILSMLYGEELAEWYMTLVSCDKVYYTSRGERIEYSQTTGQPQGYKGSFPLFAMGHHIIMLTLMREHGMRDIYPHELYRIVGDDIAISAVDYDGSILKTYIDICDSIGWVVHPSKGFQYHPDDPDHSMPIAEFAKVTVINGRVFTPIPIKLLLHNSGRMSSMLQLCTWVSQNLTNITVDELVDNLSAMRGFPKNELPFRDFIKFCRQLEISSVLQGFSIGQPIEMNNTEAACVAQSIMIETLRSVLHDQLIADHLRDKIEKKEDLSLLSFNKWESALIPLCENMENKYFYMVKKNQNVIDALSDLFSEEGLQKAVIALDLDPKQVSTIYQVVDIAELSPILLQDRVDDIISLVKEIEKLAGPFTVRSLVKKSKKDSILLWHAYERYLNIYRLAVLAGRPVDE